MYTTRLLTLYKKKGLTLGIQYDGPAVYVRGSHVVGWMF